MEGKIAKRTGARRNGKDAFPFFKMLVREKFLHKPAPATGSIQSIRADAAILFLPL
jgi:hypothetical protein